jgi:ParB-like nuclease domain
MSTEMVPLSKIKDNPWRDRVRNPICPDKVERIATSIDKTKKYWMGTYGRRMPNGDVQLAFGHHRVEAAKAEGLKEIPISIENFTDGEMLVWMASENVRGELPVAIEAISAAVKALGEGKIEVEAPSKKTNKSIIRYAPSFVAGKPCGPSEGLHPYTTQSVADYLGYVKKNTGKPRNSVEAAMGILELEERKVKGFSQELLQVNGVDASGRYVSAVRAVEIISEIKKTEIKNKERLEKSKEEIAKEQEKQREFQAKIKAREAQDKAERDALVKKQVEAREEENKKAAKKIADDIRKKDEEIEAKKADAAVKLALLESNLEAKKVAAEEQRKTDEYAPHRKEADRVIHILERRDLSEDLKALSRRPLSPADRQRVRNAATTLSTWYGDWVAALFLPSNTSRTKPKKEKR